MALKKQFLKTKPVCKVTFTISTEIAGEAGSVHLVGDFNGWDENATPMKHLKGGGFSVTVDLEQDKDYKFRYLLDGDTWVNDDEADRYERCDFANDENSVVLTNTFE